jgi:periplasmic protein TonB
MVNRSILRLDTPDWIPSAETGVAAGSESDSQTAKASPIAEVSVPSKSPFNVAPNEMPKSVRNVALTLVFSEIAHQVRASTASTGCVVLLVEGGVPVHGASSGATAREVSETLNGCSAICWQSGTLTVCEDVDSNSRFDSVSLRRLGVRSFVILPIRDKNNTVIAILEIFSSRPQAFSERDCPGLQGLGRRIADHIELADRTLASDENVKPGLRKKSVTVQRLADRYELWFNRLYVAIAGEGWNLVLGTITILLAILIGWLMGRSERESAARTAAPPSARTVRMNPQPAVTPAAPKAVNAIPQTTTDSGTPATKKQSHESTATAAGSGGRRNHLKSVRPKSEVVASNASPEDLVIVENGQQTLPPNSPLSAESKHLSSINSGENVASDAQDHDAAVRVSEDVAEQHLLERVEPDYSESARDRHLEGTVVLSIHVGKNGTVRGLSCVMGNSELCVLAAQAVRQWKFSPLIHKGAPASFDSQISMDFALP